MGSNLWAICLILGIVLFVTGGKAALILIGVGALGLLASVFSRGS